MHTSNRQLLVTASALGLGLSGFPGLVRAHGDQDHARKAGPGRKEQKDWGIAGEARAAKRTIDVRMGDDMRFTPDRIDVR